eukprot:CAMPEP_0177748230 /NCGR_PEP_ID=MMETSP0484_2-20121128/31826_1 /TAXON_ID=354590 /ORGANISM="Rhodomonas lens, Strain RHODO" /LENGTH=110 /DNA_ID=CAMNT_0019263101 /DNA_START=23 /DNA_END=355 /DNA_ORIENTATION=-
MTFETLQMLALANGQGAGSWGRLACVQTVQAGFPGAETPDDLWNYTCTSTAAEHAPARHVVGNVHPMHQVPLLVAPRKVHPVPKAAVASKPASRKSFKQGLDDGLLGLHW